MRRAAAAVALSLLLTAGAARGEDALSDDTQRALERFKRGDPDAYEALGRAPEWRAVAAVLSQTLAGGDHGLHNNACLALEVMLPRHRDLALPLEGLLGCLEHHVPTCQQKSAQVLRDALALGRTLGGREREAVRRLIPLTASQRSRVYEAALAALARLTGETLGRDPLAWARWFEATHGEKLSLEGTVYEVLAIVDTRGGLALNGEKAKDLAALEGLLAAFRDRAKAGKLAVAPVVVVAASVLESGDLVQVRNTVAPLAPVLERVLGHGHMTVAPPSDTFLAPIAELAPGFGPPAAPAFGAIDDDARRRLPWNPWKHAQVGDYSILHHGFSIRRLASGPDWAAEKLRRVRVVKVEGSTVTVSVHVLGDGGIATTTTRTYSTAVAPTLEAFFGLEGCKVTDLASEETTFALGKRPFAATKLSFTVHHGGESDRLSAWLSPEVKGPGILALKLEQSGDGTSFTRERTVATFGKGIAIDWTRLKHPERDEEEE